MLAASVIALVTFSPYNIGMEGGSSSMSHRAHSFVGDCTVDVSSVVASWRFLLKLLQGTL